MTRPLWRWLLPAFLAAWPLRAEEPAKIMTQWEVTTSSMKELMDDGFVPFQVTPSHRIGKRALQVYYLQKPKSADVLGSLAKCEELQVFAREARPDDDTLVPQQVYLYCFLLIKPTMGAPTADVE